MLVSDAQTTPAVTVRADTPLESAIALLDMRGITMLPVVNHAGSIVGVLSEADVIREAVAPDGRALHVSLVDDLVTSPLTVRDVMNTHPVTTRPTEDLATAIALMTQSAVKSLPVVDDGRVVGVISRRDVVHLLARPDREIEAELDDLFRHLGTDWLVEVQRGAAAITGPTSPGEAEWAAARASQVPGVRSVRVNADDVTGNVHPA
jgi:CBS domain-containing protein